MEIIVSLAMLESNIAVFSSLLLPLSFQADRNLTNNKTEQKTSSSDYEGTLSLLGDGLAQILNTV